MYSILLDIEQQAIIIDNRDGTIVAVRPMPIQNTRFTEREQILAEQRNLQAWELAYDLVLAANHGVSK